MKPIAVKQWLLVQIFPDKVDFREITILSRDKRIMEKLSIHEQDRINHFN